MATLIVGKWRSTICSFLHFLAFSLIILAADVFAVDGQGGALLAWKRTLNSSLEALSDWNEAESTPCGWWGVSCDANGVVVELNLQYVDLFGRVPTNFTALAALKKLVLSGTNLSGPIPERLTTDLPRLVHLDLSGNALTGEIPEGLCRSAGRLERLYLNSNRLVGAIPDAIANLSSLRSLILYDNQLEGPIPSSIGQLANLEVIRAGGNKNLQGPLPQEIGNCSSLVMLGLAETSVSGPLPSTLGQLQKLQTLAIYTALLSGPIPPELGNCANLSDIYLYENSISGSIPPQLGNNKKLTNLLLWQNNLVGVVPAELGKCAQLAVVDLSMNALTGSIPRALGNLTMLQELQLSVNQVSGSIPVELASCSNLTDLELDNNQLSGVIPPELGQLRNLRMLYLWQNKLVGNIPAEIGNCADLEAVDLSQNALTGPIPKGIFRLSRLSKLLLLGNDLSGEIPPEIGNSSALVRFRASGNRIVGTIPAEIGSLKNLSFLDLGSNRIAGPIPGEIAGCRNLTFLDLHGNAIAGELPQGVFQGLVFLQFLDLSNNSIGGDLPSDLALLTSLTKLILAGNRFTGAIPIQIGSCAHLQLLDLSRNAISGEIPAAVGRIPALEIALNLSDNDLSGVIPEEFAGLGRLAVLDISHNRLSGELRPLAGLQNLVALNVSYNNFSGRVPDTPFFSKLPLGDLEANPSLCLSQCSNEGEDSARSAARRAARVATAVLLSLAATMAVAAGAVVIGKHRRGACEIDEEKEGEMGGQWEVTLYQKMEIGVGDVARCLTTANVVGKGWSGTVYKATVPTTGAAIAVKRFRAEDDAAAAFGREIATLARVRHRNIIRLLGWAANKRTKLLFYDYLPNGTLGGLLHGGGGGGGGAGGGGVVGEWEVRIGIAVGVAEGLAYLHHDCLLGIVHGDVKADNVLLGESYEACIADFGLARAAEEGAVAGRGGDGTPMGLAGSYGYMAPEYGCMMRITRKSDVYSFGVLLLETITGKKPVDSSFPEGQSLVGWVREHLRSKKDPVEVVDPRLQGRPEAQVQEMLQALGIALLCTSNRSDDRPSMKDVAALLRGIRHEVAEARKPSATASAATDDRWKRTELPMYSSSGSPSRLAGIQATYSSTSSAGDSFK